MQKIINSNIAVAHTAGQYRQVTDRCKELYLKKAKDYGTSWRVLRAISIVDQIYIKAWRIRQIQENEAQKIEDRIESEFIGIVNYGIIALIQIAFGREDNFEPGFETAKEWYEQEAAKVEALMQQKNHDYGEAWRSMSQESFVDLILVKLLRIKQILANNGKTTVSEGIDANFADIVNYGVFALIRISEGQ